VKSSKNTESLVSIYRTSRTYPRDRS